MVAARECVLLRRAMRTHFAPLALALFACGTDKAALDPQPPAGGQQLATDVYHLEPGQEVYMCYQFYSPDQDVAITKAETIAEPGIHHLALFQAFGTHEPDEAHECNTPIKISWLPVFVTGTGSKDLEMPSGVGMMIKAKTQYILQLHLQNTQEAAIDIRAGVNLTYDHNPTALQAAGIWAAGKQDINIPPTTTDYQVSESCTANKDRHVFAVFPHMHKLGTKMDVTVTRGGQTTSYYSVDPWQFGNQPIELMDGPLGPTDKIEVTCHWNNPTNAAVTYGESSDNEMCYFVTFYYPYDHLDGCID